MASAAGSRTSLGSVGKVGVLLAIGVPALTALRTQLGQLAAAVPSVVSVGPGALALMVAFQIASIAMAITLIRTVLPQLSWRDAATSQVVSSAAARLVPAGAVVGAGALYRCLARTGIDPHRAVGTLAATGVVSNLVLFGVPTAGLLLLLAGMPLPPLLSLVCVVGFALFAGFAALTLGALWLPGLLLGPFRLGARLVAPLFRRADPAWTPPEGRLLEEQERLRHLLTSKWRSVTLVVIANWVFEAMVLFVPLATLGAGLGFGIVLLTFAATAMLGMLPFTPGGVGIADVGLLAMLTGLGVDPTIAATSVVAYRLASWWMPFVVGLFVWAASTLRID